MIMIVIHIAMHQQGRAPKSLGLSPAGAQRVGLDREPQARRFIPVRCVPLRCSGTRSSMPKTKSRAFAQATVRAEEGGALMAVCPP